MAAPNSYFIDPSLQDRASVTISNVTTTATVTQNGHGYSNSDRVKVYGANEADYNGYFTISNVTSNTYDYTMAGDPGGSATGSPTASKVNIGLGTVGSPYADTQETLDTVTQDVTDGDKFNLKEGTDEILVTSLSFTTYGSPGQAYPVIFRGYTTAEDDGGRGSIDGNSNSVVSNGTLSYVIWQDMHLHSSGSAQLYLGDNETHFVNVIFNDSTHTKPLEFDNYCSFIGCRFYNLDGVIEAASFCNFLYSKIEESSNNTNWLIRFLAGHCLFFGNTITLTSTTATNAVLALNGQNDIVLHNTFYSANASRRTGTDLGNARVGMSAINNIYVGFSGVNGEGLSINSANTALIVANKFYNNTVDVDASNDYNAVLDNETFLESPFIDPDNDDFRLKDQFKGTGWPETNMLGTSIRSYYDPGAFQRIDNGSNRFSASFNAVSISVAQDLFEIVAPSNKTVIVYGCIINQTTISNNEMLNILVHRGSTAGSGGTIADAKPIDSAAGLSGTIIKVNNTTQSTEGNQIYSGSFNVVDGFLWYPQPEACSVISPGERLIIELQTAPSVSMVTNGTVWFEEIGG
jgi:hypothetical protein